MGGRALARVLAILVLVVVSERPGRAIDAIPGLTPLSDDSNGEVTIDAEHVEFDQRSNEVTARGAVKITRGTMVLTADSVKVNRSTQVADAQGNVVLVDPQGTLSADVLTLDLVQETGGMDRGSVFLNANRYQLTGDRFEKQPGQSYSVTNGSLTTCICRRGESPSWSVRGQQVTLDLEGYGRIKGGTFAVKDVPILYLPYGIFPIQRERQSGFLFPRFGYSNRRGFQFEQPFYININKSHDATVSFDLETNARIGLLGEYRYALSPETLGEVSGSYFNEQIRGASSEDVVNSSIANPNIPLNRWSAGLTHDQWLPFGAKGFADVLRVSDDLFLREINVFTFNPGVDVALRTRRFERSRFGVARDFKDGLLIASSTWYQDFINPDRYDFQVPPRIEGQTMSRFFDDRLLVNFAGEGVNFRRKSGYDGQRLDVRPELEFPYRLGNSAYGSVRGGLRGTAYHLDNTSVPEQVNTNTADPGTQPPSILPTLDKSAARGLFYLGGDVGTSFSRVFPFEHLGMTRLKHTIEPELGYLFVPRTATRQAALPIYDDVDRVNQRSVFTYGFTSRLLGRLAGGASPTERKHSAVARESDGEAEVRPPGGAQRDEGSVAAEVLDPLMAPTAGPIRELARFSIFQSYDVANQSGDFNDVDPTTGQPIPGSGSRASDLSLSTRLTPSPYLSLEGSTDYSVTGGGTKSATLGLFLSDPRTPSEELGLESLRGRTRIGVGYRFVANQAVEEVNGGVVLRLTNRLYAAYEARYDNRSGRFLENRYGLRMISSQECWVVDLGVSNNVNPNETQIRLLISLVGLAQFGKEPFRRSLGGIAPPAHGFLGE